MSGSICHRPESRPVHGGDRGRLEHRYRHRRLRQLGRPAPQFGLRDRSVGATPERRRAASIAMSSPPASVGAAVAVAPRVLEAHRVCVEPGPAEAQGPAGPSRRQATSTSTALGTNLVVNRQLHGSSVRSTNPSQINCEIDTAKVQATSTASWALDSGFAFAPRPNNSSVVVTTAGVANPKKPFTAITKDGSSTATGIVGCVNSAGLHLNSGYVTGV